MYRRTSWMPEPRSGISSLNSLLLLKFQKKMLRSWVQKDINVFPASGLMLIRTNLWKEEQTKNMCQSSKALVSCGNFEVSEGLRSDSPTADTEAHNILCCWAAIQGAQLHSADVASAYFQGRPLDRVLIMRQPRGGLPGIDPEVFFLVRVPIYGLTDSGRGFWLRLDGDARSSGLKQSKFYPGLYFLPGPDKDCVALMATHVDDILCAYIPEGKSVIDSFLEKFNLGSSESNSFRYCGKQFERTADGTITQDTCDNTRRIKPIKIAPGRSASEPLGKDDVTRLRSVTGSLSSISGATVAILHDANAVVQLAQQGIENKLIFPREHLTWGEVGIITVTDASFSNEKNYKSQQGRFHFLGDINEIKDPKTTSYRVMPLGFASNTIRRVCRSTLQCEAYSLQAGQESGDKLRGALAELMGQLDSMKTWLDDSRRHGYLDCHRNYGLGCSDQEHAPGPHYPRLEGVHLSCTEEALEPTFSLASCDPWRTGWVWVWPV